MPDITFVKPALPRSGALVLLLAEGAALAGLAKAAAGFGLQLLEAGGVAEALVAALGVNPADDRG